MPLPEEQVWRRRAHDALEQDGSSLEGRLALDRDGASLEGVSSPERGRTSLEGASDPRARQNLT
jgi:hypothetical protein